MLFVSICNFLDVLLFDSFGTVIVFVNIIHIFAFILIKIIMNAIRLTITLGVLLCLFACHRTPHYPSTLLQAGQLMDIAPDSVLTLLASFKDSIRAESEATQMYYQLLIVKANDKCYISHISDSLIKVVVNYYEEHGTVEQLMEAYYYQGSVYRDMGDAPQALEFYQKAVDTSEDKKEYKMLARIYNQMGMLYMYQKMYDEALPVLKKAYTLFTLAKDSVAPPYTLRDIGRAFTAQHNVDSTLFYYEAGYQAAKRVNDTEGMSTIQSELAGIYTEIGLYRQARVALLQSERELRGNGNLAPHYSDWGDLYKKAGKPDSAMFYYHKALEIGNIYVKRRACWELYQLKRAGLCNDEALQYIDQYLFYRDSIQQITDIEAVKKVEMLYNYRHVEKENSRLMLANEKNKTFFYQLAVVVILLLLISAGVIYYERRKKQQLIEQGRRLRFFEELRHKESLEQIEQNNKQIISLKEQLVLVREQNDLAKEELLIIRKNSLEEKNSSIASSCLEREALISLFHHSAIYLLIVENCKNPNFRMKEIHWIELRKEINIAYNDFTNRLYALYPKLSEVEFHVCYLIKVSISASDIAALVCLKNNSVSSIRKRLYQKIHGVSGAPNMLDTFIADF